MAMMIMPKTKPRFAIEREIENPVWTMGVWKTVSFRLSTTPIIHVSMPTNIPQTHAKMKDTLKKIHPIAEEDMENIVEIKEA